MGCKPAVPWLPVYVLDAAERGIPSKQYGLGDVVDFIVPSGCLNSEC